MIEKTTTNRNYPKPDATNFLQDDVTRLESALDAIDTDIHTIKQEQTNLAAVKADQTGVDELRDSLAQLREQVETPPAIPVLSAADLTGESFTLSWSKVAGADYYCLDVATDETFSSFAGDYNDKQISGTSHEIVGLQLNTAYYCRIRSVNSFGAGDSCTVLNVTTRALVPVTRTFYYSSSIETWMVPEAVDSITIEARGARGGNAGGYGARMRGTFQLQPGNILKILVGEKGGMQINYMSGGGGGTFVAMSDNAPLLVAGGGGGRAGDQFHENANANIGNEGKHGIYTNDSTSNCGAGGVNGMGGSRGHGGGGGGFLGDGELGQYIHPTAKSFVNGGDGGGQYGGFGGGGGRGNHGAGGGGGYSGGGGSYSYHTVGGGGGSYNDGTGQDNGLSDQDDGKVVISWTHIQ